MEKADRPGSRQSDGRISVVEAMRGAASVGVALFHFSGQLTSAIPVVLHHYGWLGVDVFFVISGFVIPLSLYQRGYELRDFPNFMCRRIVRLEPPYIVSIGLMLIVWHLAATVVGFQGITPSYSLGQLISHLFYVIPLTNYHWISPVYWSLAYEFLFYIAAGLTFPILISRRIEVTVLAVCAAVAAFYIVCRFDVRLLEFAAGMLVMRFVVDRGDRLRTAPWIAACLGVIFWEGGPAIGGAASLATAGILIFRERNLGRLAVFLGGISYSLYLTHLAIGGKIVNLGRRFADGALYEITLIVIALSVSILFAMLFVRVVEAPATRASRMLAMGATRRAAAPAYELR